MITEKDTIKCEAIFNDARTHRYLWKRVWDKDNPTVSVIMLNPCLSDNIVTDTTTSLVVNNVAKLEEFGGVEILNLFSKLTTKLRFADDSETDINDDENDDYIVKSVSASSKTILAWGKAASTNKVIEERATQVINLLEPYKDKLYMISDGIRSGFKVTVSEISIRKAIQRVRKQLYLFTGFLKMEL